jgi:hypothetical protein
MAVQDQAREFWERAFFDATSQGLSVKDAAVGADAALIEWEKRWLKQPKPLPPELPDRGGK